MDTKRDNATTVLVVDDDLDLLPFLADTLHVLTNYTVVTAEDGAIGLERLVASQPACVVVDVKMPELDGLQFLRALRGDPDTQHTPVIVLTALAQEKDQFAGMASGADRYLVKPVDPADLVAAIHQAVAIGEQERIKRLQALVDAPPPDMNA